MNDIIYVGKHALTYSVTKHLHKNWELIYCTSGRGELVFQDRILPYAENSVAVIPPLIPHTNVGKNSFTNIHVMLGETTLGYTEPFVITAAENGFLRNAFSAAFYYHSNGGVESAALLPIYGQLIVSTIETTGSGDVKTNYLVRQIAAPDLRDRIQKEVDKLAKQKKFGLVFEEHLPECTPLYDIPVKPGTKVALKAGSVDDFWRVLSLKDGKAVCLKRGETEAVELPVEDLVTIAEFGDPIYPYLKPLDSGSISQMKTKL